MHQLKLGLEINTWTFERMKEHIEVWDLNCYAYLSEFVEMRVYFKLNLNLGNRIWTWKLNLKPKLSLKIVFDFILT